MTDIPDLTALSVETLAAWQEAISAEQRRRFDLVDIPQRLQQWADIYAAALAASPQEPVEYEPGVVYGPGQLVTYEGQTWRNSTTGPLHNTTPGDTEHPFWVLVTDDAPIAEWTTVVVLHPGDVYSYNGHTWRYRGADGATGDPNLAPANNAAWELIA